ncbi:hypothetical protein ABN034_31985 [Actinopolymorpha sp. B11F2]|uniref:hypothetical protein n=1 Tax=Actinopolymorpha sp. B11F2 TaxID=3160862 RepID=UPI0032E4AB37
MTDEAAGTAGMTLVDRPEPEPATNDVVVQVHASGFTSGELGEIVHRVRDRRLRTNIGNVATLDDAVAAFNPTERISGQTIIRIRP